MLKYLAIAAAVACLAWNAAEPSTAIVADRAAQLELVTR